MSKTTHERTKVTVIKHETLSDKIKALFKKHYDVIMYIIFGALTTIVNIVTYAICAHLFRIDEVISTIIGQIVSIIFAYVTNRIWVFRSEARGLKAITREIFSFAIARAATFALDVIIMFIFVKQLNFPDMPVKIASNIIVIIINYIASKLFIFVKPKKQ